MFVFKKGLYLNEVDNSINFDVRQIQVLIQALPSSSWEVPRKLFHLCDFQFLHLQNEDNGNHLKMRIKEEYM